MCHILRCCLLILFLRRDPHLRCCSPQQLKCLLRRESRRKSVWHAAARRCDTRESSRTGLFVVTPWPRRETDFSAEVRSLAIYIQHEGPLASASRVRVCASIPNPLSHRNQNEGYRCYTKLPRRFKVRISRREPDPRYVEIAVNGL